MDKEWEDYQELKEKINEFRIKLSAREEVAREYEIELKDANDSIVWWQNRYKALERENEHLRTELNTSKSKREKVTSKYKTLKKLQEENERLKERNHINIERNAQAYKIVDDYEFRIKKAVVYIKEHIQKYDIDGSIGDFDEFDMLTKPNYLLNILQNGSDDNVKN